jgi:exportin-7
MSKQSIASVQATLVGLVHDLRGFLFAIQGRRNFTPFFEWLYPDHLSILLHALEAWFDDPLAVQTLKFFEELATNRTQRLNFDVSSVKGILIFREIR